jgi:hypothetical protein
LKFVKIALPEPRWGFGLLSLVTLVAGALIVAAFWTEGGLLNILTEVWGVTLAGVVLWWILEEQSEGIQQRAWLRRHRNELDLSLASLTEAASFTAARLLQLSIEQRLALAGHLSIEAWMMASAEAKERVKAIQTGSVATVTKWARGVIGQELRSDVANDLASVLAAVQDAGPFLEREAHIRSAIADYRAWCTLIASMPVLDSVDPSFDNIAVMQTTLPEAGRLAAHLCDEGLRLRRRLSLNWPRPGGAGSTRQ